MEQFIRPNTRSQNNAQNDNANIENMRHGDIQTMSFSETMLSPASLPTDSPSASPLRLDGSPQVCDRSSNQSVTVDVASQIEPISIIDMPSIDMSSDNCDVENSKNSELLVEHLFKIPKIRYKDIVCYECTCDIDSSERMMYCCNFTSYTCQDCDSYIGDPCCERQSLYYIT